MGLNFDDAAHDEAHILEEFAGPIDLVARFDLAREHLDYQLVAEALLAEVEGVREALQHVLKEELDELGLHLGRQLLVEVEFLHDHVEVVAERLFETLVHRHGQMRRK